MPKKLTMLGALTAALVFGYLGFFNSSASGVPLLQFSTTGASEIDVVQCYDTNPANEPVVSLGRVVCNPSNPNPATTGLASSTNYTSWQIINLPIGNRLTLPAGFTPSDAGEWSNTAIACGPVDGNNRCTAGTIVGDITSRTDIFCNQQIDILAAGGTGGAPGIWPDRDTDGGGADLGWVNPEFSRIAAAADIGGNGALGSADPDSYIHQTVTMPSTWEFRSSDLSLLTLLYIDGTLPFTIPGGSKLNNVVYRSNYPGQTGLNVNQALLGGSPDNPPSDDVSLCLSAPQDSVSKVGYLVSPAGNTIIPRWTILQSDVDPQDREVKRILDWQCDRIGAGLPDADGDCDPDASDTNDGNKDTDADGVPDGVEVAYNSSPTVPDTDADGANDYAEIFQFTDPQDTDTDNDGQADKQDLIPTNGAAVPAGNNLSVAALNPEVGYDAADATDDNCPNESNSTQLNTDSLWQYHGMGGNADPDGAGTFIGQNTSTGDRSNPDEDVFGDACDSDDDNDALPDATEPLTRIAPWSGWNDPNAAGDAIRTSVCVGVAYVGGVAPLRVMSPVMGDVDYDMVLDGRECQFRSRPDASCRTAAADAECVGALPESNFCSGSFMTSVAVRDKGCAQPAPSASSGTWPAASGPAETACANSLDDDGDTVINDGCAGAQNPGGGDTDADFLYMPGLAGNHTNTEVFFRTMDWNISLGVQNDDLDGDGAAGDADGDTDRDANGGAGTTIYLRDGIELRFYGTEPYASDTDNDGCRDADEVGDMNGDGAQSVGDTGLRLQAVTSYDSAPANGRMDRNVNHTPTGSTTVLVSKYNLATNRDLNKDGTGNVGDTGVLGALFAAPGACGAESAGTAVVNATKHLP